MLKYGFAHKSSLLLLFLLIAAIPASAQDRLCDTAFEDCRTPVWQLIDNETVGIDVAFWFMDDTSYVPKLINKFNSGVPVRVLVDPRANLTHPVNADVLNQLAAAGIPMRKNVVTGGVLHWKMMLFVGQNKVQFSAANYGPQNFVPTVPFSNYIDELIYISDNTSIVNSFKTKYDDKWIDNVRFANYANISGPLTRTYPIFTKDPELNYPPEESFANRSVSRYNQETQKIDAIIFRNTDDRHANALIAALGRGVPLRILNEPDTYRTTTYFRHSMNIDRMFMAGAQIKNRAHIGLTHEKLVLLYGQGMAIFGSSNMSVPSSDSQDEHNLFTQKPELFNPLVEHFERKWNSSSEYQPFTPLPPDAPTSPSPANSAVTPSPDVTLRWEGGFFAWRYDLYFGTTPNPSLLTANINTGFPGPATAETFQLPPLQPGVTYFWRVVGKTMANMAASSPVWSFTVAGTGNPPVAPTGLIATAISSSRIDLSWGNVADEAGYRIERSLSSGGPWEDIGSTQVDVTTFQDLGLASGTTYFYRVLAFNGGGNSPPSNTANATTQSSSTPPPPGILLVDDFNDNSLDSSKWTLGQITGSTDFNIQVSESSQRLGVGPLLQNTSGFHFNGIVSNTSYNFTGAFAYVQVVTPPPSNSISELRLSVAGGNSPAGNLYRFIVVGPNLKLQRVIGGSAVNLVAPFAYNATTMKFLRLRHDSSSGNVVFETAPASGDPNLPGTWTIRYQEPWTNWNGSSGVLLTGVRFEVRAGTASADPVAAGILSVDNFRATRPAPVPTVTSVSPASGPDSGGTQVSISGSSFASGATVQFGGVPATNVNVVNATLMTATTPAHAAGTVDVTVTNSDLQSGTLNNGFTYQFPADPGNEPPQVSASASPTSGVAPLQVNFTSNASDTDGVIVAFNWTFGDGGTSTAQSPSHTYQQPGTFIAQVTVTDDMGATANALVTVQVDAQGGETVLLADDFNDNSLDTAKWTKGQLTGSSDSNIQVTEASQRLAVGPLLQNTSGFHFNGIINKSAVDFNGAYVYVQVVTPPPAGATSELRLSVAGSNSPSSNLYRFIIIGANLKLQRVIGGTAANVIAPLAYNATSMKFLRIRHDSATGNVVFETAPASASDANLPGAWSVRHQEPWVNWNGSSGVNLSGVRFEIRIGTATADPVPSGILAVDNFRAARP
ncbi:MAG TPA: phospholipase D-like domain-containing protein [Pyrinomonadaceae bacterium]|nr:phospholipase D-like domain-containing protein [Pyrinomonadaceae bacterium]